MKNSILLFLGLMTPVSFLLANSEPLSGPKIIDSVLQKTETIADEVARATDATHAGYCKEEIKNLPRLVVKRDPNVPVITCIPDDKSLLVEGGADYSQMIRDYRIEFHPSLEAISKTRNFRLFMHELKKFPQHLLKEMADAGGRIRVMVGDGISEDPTWDLERQAKIQRLRDSYTFYNKYGGYKPTQTEAEINRAYSTTSEGIRDWTLVSGAGGVFMDPTMIAPTRIMINHLYLAKHKLPDGKIQLWDQGSSNLVLHEHAHALDSLYGHQSISTSPQWRAVMNDPQTKAYTEKIFSNYENYSPIEGFAEAFSYYHSCEASRNQMETHAPALANFFKNFTTVKDLRPDLYSSWRSRYNR